MVFGDIGTSPLYAVSAIFNFTHIAVTPVHVFGVLSLIFWALILVITLKYLVVVLNADNKGEGGVLALTALVVNTNAKVRARNSTVRSASSVPHCSFPMAPSPLRSP